MVIIFLKSPVYVHLRKLQVINKAYEIKYWYSLHPTSSGLFKQPFNSNQAGFMAPSWKSLESKLSWPSFKKKKQNLFKATLLGSQQSWEESTDF